QAAFDRYHPLVDYAIFQSGPEPAVVSQHWSRFCVDQAKWVADDALDRYCRCVIGGVNYLSMAVINPVLPILVLRQCGNDKQTPGYAKRAVHNDRIYFCHRTRRLEHDERVRGLAHRPVDYDTEI